MSGGWSILFSFCIWFVWKNRNEAIFSHKQKNHLFVSHEAVTKATEFFTGLHVHTIHATTTVFPHWSSPPTGFFKLNSDGASKSNPTRAGAGGLIRDSNGRWVLGYKRNVGNANSFLAELWGLRDGLQLAEEHNLTPLIVEMDALMIVELLNNGKTSPKYNALISDCRELMKKMEVRKVDHVFRECNKSADALANLGLLCSSNTRFVILEEAPSALLNLLSMDYRGVTTPRTCNISVLV